VQILRALANRNYRLYFGGQILSIIGTWMQQIALSWLVYRLTDSTFMLGLVTFAGQIPNLLLAPWAGALSDRYPRRKLLMLTTSLAALQALSLAILTIAGLITPMVILGMALVLGIISGFDQPIRQAFIPELVEKREDIANAVALTSFTIHSSRFIGPMIGGFVVARFGEGMCFGLNALSYAGTIIALGVMTTRHVETVHRSVGDALREGATYVFDHRAIRLLLVIVATMALFGGSYQTLLPYFARDFYHGDVRTFALMTTAGGLGACMGTIFLASRRDTAGLEHRIVLSALLVAAGLAIFATTHWFEVAVAAMVVMGFCSINTVAASNALIQSLVEDGMRGRVMALFSMAFFGLGPVGNLAVGWAGRHFGAQLTLLVCALAIFVVALGALRTKARIDFSLPVLRG
jgi:MFS family permease